MKEVSVSNKIGGAIFMFLALLILCGAGYQAFRNWEFANKAEHVTGAVENKYIAHGNQNVHLKVQYRYVTGGVTYTPTTTVSHDAYGTLKAGDSVPVAFLPAKPYDSRIDLASERERRSNRVWLLSLIGLPAFAFAAFIYFLPFKKTHA